MMKILVTAAVLTLSSGAAFAGSEAYPDFSNNPTITVVAGGVLAPAQGGESAPESANSLPSGFAQGTAAYQQAQSVGRYLRAQADMAVDRTIAKR